MKQMKDGLAKTKSDTMSLNLDELLRIYAQFNHIHVIKSMTVNNKKESWTAGLSTSSPDGYVCIH